MGIIKPPQGRSPKAPPGAMEVRVNLATPQPEGASLLSQESHSAPVRALGVLVQTLQSWGEVTQEKTGSFMPGVGKRCETL